MTTETPPPPRRPDAPAVGELAQTLDGVLNRILEEAALQEIDPADLPWDRPVLVLRSAHMARLASFLGLRRAMNVTSELHVMSHARDEKAIRTMVGHDFTFHAYPTPGPYCLEQLPSATMADLRAVGFGALVFLDAGVAATGLEEVHRLLADIDETPVLAYRGDGTLARASDWHKHALATAAVRRLNEWCPHLSGAVPPSAAARANPAVPINRDPAMTKYIVAAGVLRDDPVTIVDVGARGGFNAEWRVFGDALRIIGFEPDETECALLAASAPPHITYIPAALGRKAGEATLYVTAVEASSGLHRTDMEYFSRLLNGENGQVAGERRIQLTTLDEALSRVGVVADFIKLDAEGAELEILQGGAGVMATHGLLGILSEVRFQREINNCPTLSDLDLYVQPFGFRLYGLHYTHQSRRALPYPGLADYRLPNGERFFAYTTHGQIMDGDALYFRDLLLAVNAPLRRRLSATQLLKAAAFFEIYSLNDCAAELILAHRELIQPLIDCDELLDLLAPPVRGRNVGFQEYIRAYFDSRGVDTGA